MLTLTSLIIWLRWEQAGSDGAVELVGVKVASLVALELGSLEVRWKEWIWLRW